MITLLKTEVMAAENSACHHRNKLLIKYMKIQISYLIYMYYYL